MRGCSSSCRRCKAEKPPERHEGDYTIALAGNANVGKSAIFTQLTGVDQIIGNWPGKTVERAEGLLTYKGHRFHVIDLPGIYSFSTYSMEEIVSRDFIACEHPDAVVNVIDASALERNLFLTIQLLELAPPLLLVVNQIDLAEKRGIRIDIQRLSDLLGVPVVETIAIKGKGIDSLSEALLELVHIKRPSSSPKYSKDIEESLAKLLPRLSSLEIPYPRRWMAIKLLEGDSEITRQVQSQDPTLVQDAKVLSEEIEMMRNDPVSVVMSAERYLVADRIASEVISIHTPQELQKRKRLTDKIDQIALHPHIGYLFAFAVIGALLFSTFIFGKLIDESLQSLISSFLGEIEMSSPIIAEDQLMNGERLSSAFLNGAISGLVAGLTMVLSYVLPFYIFLAVLEDSGYLTRIAVMMDMWMHKIGLHGKAIIPLILGLGCNVPACTACRIMETTKQKLIAAFLVTLVPCSATTVVIFGLISRTITPYVALLLYGLVIILIVLLGRVLYKVIPGESSGLIMEIPDYHIPSFSVVMRQTWTRTRSLIWIVIPAYILGSALMRVLNAEGFLIPINTLLEPITVFWLGLPASVGILLIFGVIRKELILVLLSALHPLFATEFTQIQLITLALVTTLYIPCFSVILVLGSEFGWRRAVAITVSKILLSLFVGGIAFRILSLFLHS